jgi:hypothetical protein
MSKLSVCLPPWLVGVLKHVQAARKHKGDCVSISELVRETLETHIAGLKPSQAELERSAALAAMPRQGFGFRDWDS